MFKSLNNCVKLTFFFVTALFPGVNHSQPWLSLEGVGAEGDEVILEIDANFGHLLVGGSFTQDLTIGGQELNTIGKRDIWFFQRDSLGNILQLHQVGSEEDDQLAALHLADDGSIYAFGEFWFEAFLDTTRIILDQGSRGLFLAKYAETGALEWVRILSGKGLKVAGDMAVRSPYGLFTTGYFSDSLRLGDTTLVAGGDQDVFLARWDTTGDLLWAARQGGEGNFRSLTLDVGQTGFPVIAGDFQGFAVFGEDTLATNTADNDVFTASFSLEGQVQWARKAGGILEDTCEDIAVDENGDIWLTGNFVGVLNPGNDDLKLSSDGFPNDGFLLAYSEAGVPLYARRIGGEAYDYGVALELRDGEVLLAGYFQETLTFAGRTISSLNNMLNGYVAAFDKTAQPLTIRHLASPVVSFPTSIKACSDGTAWVGGSFESTLSLTGLPELFSEGARDGFLARLSPLFTPVNSPVPAREKIDVFPNPFSASFFLRSEKNIREAWLLDALGRPVMKVFPGENRAPETLPAGVYRLLLKWEEGGEAWGNLLKVDSL